MQASCRGPFVAVGVSCAMAPICVLRGESARTIRRSLEFAALVLRGLSALGPLELPGDDLTLELGLSFWIRHSGVDMDAAWATIRTLPRTLAEEAGLDQRTEPIPLVGRSPRLALINLAYHLNLLLPRAASWAGIDPRGLSERVIV
jgi:hypothetical protein